MFEGTIASILNKYLGKYVANLDSSSLDFGLFGGDLEFTDLAIRPDALVELNLPVEVKAGHVGYLKIDIPWTQLFSGDIKVEVDDVYILAGPTTDRQYDPYKEKLLADATKRQLLESIENSGKPSSGEVADGGQTFAEKMTVNLINRVQVSIRHIHIRYEDTITNGDHAFACGIMLKQLVACTTDAHWEPTKSDSSPNLMHKILKMEALSVYWNPYVSEKHLLKTRLNTDGWRNVLRIAIDSHSMFEEGLNFIIDPVAAQARMIFNTDNSFTLPKLFMDFTLEELEVLMSRQQFLNLINLSESFNLMRVNQRYRKYHPNVSLKVSPRSWWHYAYTAVVEERIRPFSWQRIQMHRMKFNAYKSVYKKMLEDTGNEEIAATLKIQEEGLNVTNILIAREQAKLEFAREAPERARRKVKENKGWFSSWLWGDDDDEELVEVDSLHKDDWFVGLTEEEQKKLYDGIGYQENTASSPYPAKYIAQKVQIILKNCSVSLVNFDKKILQVSVNHMLATLEHRPGASAFRISCNTESFSIEGASIEHELIPILTSDIGVYAPSVNQVFALDFETHPVYMDADYSLSLSVQPVEIVYDEHSISEVTAFFQLPNGSMDLKTAATDTLTSVADYSRASLQYAIEQHKTIHVAINMRSPYVVIPEYGTLHRGGNVLIVDLGTLHIESELQSREISLEDATMSEIESRLYDQFNVRIKDVKLLLADSGDDWHTAQIQPNSQFHILPSVQLFVTFFNAVTPEFTQLPRHKLEARLPSLEINMSDKRLLLFAAFFKNFPVPTSTSMATIGDDMLDGSGPPYAPPQPLDTTDSQLDPDHGMLLNIRRSVLGRKLIDKMVEPRRSLTRVPTLMYTAGDESFYSASDFSDEDVDKFSDLLTIKSVDDNASVANTINVLMRMSLGELLINLSKEMDKDERPYLMFRIDRLKVDSALTVHGYAAYATLGGIQLVDKIHVGPSGEYMEVLSTTTNSSTNLVSIMYRMVEPSCPDFATYYGAVEHALKVKVQSMSTLFDQASMMYLNAFVQSLLSSLQSIDMKASTTSSASDVSAKDKSSITDRIVNITDQVDSLPSNGIKLNLAAEMQNFTIKLTDSDNNLAEVKIKGFEGSVVARPTRTVFRCRLQDLSVKDMTSGAIHPHILMLQDESLLDLKFVKFNKVDDVGGDNKGNTECLDYSIRLRVGHIQGTVLGKFYWEITRFFEPFINQEITDIAKQRAVESMSRQGSARSLVELAGSQVKVENISSQSLRIKMDVDLRAPTLLLPHDSRSTEMMLVQLGKVWIQNSFVTNQLNSDLMQQWNLIHINMSHIQVQRVRLNVLEDTSEILHTILEPLTLKGDVKMALEPIVSDLSLDISGNLQKVKLHVFQKDIQLLLGIIRYNISEGSPPPSPDIFESPTLQDIHLEDNRDSALLSPSVHPTTSHNATANLEKKSMTSILFKLEGLSLSLLTDNGKELATQTDLCYMDMSLITVAGSSHKDGDIKVNVSLHTLSVTDTRPDNDVVVKKVLHCSKKVDSSDEFPLVSLIYKIGSDGSHKADVMVEKLYFNVHVPYVMLLYDFFSGALLAFNQPTKMEQVMRSSKRQRQLRPISYYDPNDQDNADTNVPTTSTTPSLELNVYGSLKKPEIIIYADPTKSNSRVAILRSDIAFELRKDSVKQVIWSKITDLHLITKMNILDNKQNLVMMPCSLEFNQESFLESGAINMTASITRLQVFVSASVMQLFWDVLTLINGTKKSTGKPTSSNKGVADSQDLWRVSKVTSERWLRDIPDSGLIHHIQPTKTPKQNFQLDISDINLYFEIETLDYHEPILHLHSSIEAKIEEWSRKMHIELEFHLDVLYFNEKVSEWEPLIEPVMEREGVYRPWEAFVKVVKAKSFPMICMYQDNDVTIPEELQTEVQQMMHRSRIKSSSSESEEAETDFDMTVIRHKSLRRLRHGSDRSYDSSRHSSVQGESDSEPEGFISNMTSKLGNIFSSDSSDADVSENEDNDEQIDLTLDKPVFLTSRGPVHIAAGSIPPGVDTVDSGQVGDEAEEDDGDDKCMYVMVDAMDCLNLNVTPQAISVLKDVLEALTNTDQSELQSVRMQPTFTLDNKLGLHAYVTFDSKFKIHKENVIDATAYQSGHDSIIHEVDYSDDIEVINTDNKDEEDEFSDGYGVKGMLARAGHTLISAGAFVFDDDDDYLSGNHLDSFRLKLQVEGFEQTRSILHKRACRRLIPLNPIKSDEMELENGVKYTVVMEVDKWHGKKSIQIYSPLKLHNHLTLAIDVCCRTEDLKKFKATRNLASSEKFSLLATVSPDTVYNLPLFVSYHCPIYVKPADISYELTNNSMWWPEMLQGKDRVKSFWCHSSDEEQKSFHFKAVCREGDKLKPPQPVAKSLPYYTIHLHPPVILHNYLPYDIHFALQGTTTTSSLTHGDATPLYTVDTSNTYKLLITLPDYMGSDWLGTLEISPDMEEFRAVTMETEVDSDNLNRHLSISIHADLSSSLDLRIYSPYWIINKTDLPLQLRGSLSEAVYEFGTSPNPLLFRFKRNKKKKAKLRVYESRWSQSFSTDTVGSGGVVICNDKERGKKYMFLVQITMSRLRLTKIVTILPFFLIMNQSRHKLRYMEENENADLWIDIDIDQYQPFWPVTESFNMLVKFDGSNVTSTHFPIKSCHNTVLRMDHGRALCVEVNGGTDTPITIQFTNYDHGDAPARVDNLCEDVFIKIHQKNQSQVTLLSPNQSILYTWDEPSAERTLMWNVYGRKKPSYPAFISKDGSGEVRLRVPFLKAGNQSIDLTDAADTDGSSPEDESDEPDGTSANISLIVKTRSDKMVVFWVSYLDGLQRVLLFTQDERVAKSIRKGHVQSVDLPRRRNLLQVNEGENANLALFASLEGLSVSIINGMYKEVALMTIASCPAVWEVEVKDKWRHLNVDLSTWLEDQWRGGILAANLQGQIEADLSKMQMMKPFMGSLRRTFHPGFWCQYRASKHHMAINASLQKLQIDNQLQDAYFPTVLSPTPLPTYIAKRMGPKPFIELGLMRRSVPEQNVDTIRYAKILIQEFDIKLDKGFILSLVDVVSHLMPVEKESYQLQMDMTIARQTLREAAAVIMASRPQRIYFEYIHLSPLKFHISFSLGGKVHISDQTKKAASTSSLSGDIIDFFINSVGVSLTEIKNVELRLAYFERKGVVLSSQQLLAQVQAHFTQQAFQQAYVLIFGLDVLGNPYGLVKDFTQGLGDFFYEPFLGSIQGRDEFTEGLARGVQSVMGNTIGGMAGSVSLMTGGIGRTLAALSFDEDYKRKRRVRMQQDPHDLPTSLFDASKTLALGIGLGLSGVVLDPIKGAHEDGVEGFFKGVGKGLLGLLTKPAGGVVDMISMAFDGMRRAAEMEFGVVARARLPRCINPQTGLKPYSPYKAAGNRLLQSLMKGELAKSDMYYTHAALSREEKAKVIMITDKHLLMIEKCRFWGGWAVDWMVTLDSILGVPAVTDGRLVFKVKNDESGVNLFSSGEKEIISKEGEILAWLQGQINKVIKNVEQ